MLDIFTAALEQLTQDSDINNPDSLHSIAKGRFLEPDFVAQVDPVADVTGNLPRVTYYGSDLPPFMDKLSLILVVTSYAKTYNECVALSNRIIDLLYTPFNRPGTSITRLRPANSWIGFMKMPDPTQDIHNPKQEVYGRVTKYEIHYVKK